MQPQSYGRRVLLMAVNGPQNSTLTVYRGYIPTVSDRVSAVYPADVRTYDAAGAAPIVVRPGEAALFVWTGGATAEATPASVNVISEVQ